MNIHIDLDHPTKLQLAAVGLLLTGMSAKDCETEKISIEDSDRFPNDIKIETENTKTYWYITPRGAVQSVG